MLEMVTRLKSAQKHAARIQPRKPLVVKSQTARQRWLLTARLNQLLPVGDWFVWLILAGRGFGETRVEAIAEWARNTPRGRFALVAQTIADARDTMVEGQCGLLSVLDERELRGGHSTCDRHHSGVLYTNTAFSGFQITDYHPGTTAADTGEEIWGSNEMLDNTSFAGSSSGPMNPVGSILSNNGKFERSTVDPKVTDGEAARIILFNQQAQAQGITLGASLSA
jgi:hypothetical protein